MADYRLKLSDGTTTIDLYGGTDSIVREGGLSMPPPNVNASYLNNPFSDGSKLTSSTYSNRTINIQTRIWGSSLADLKTNIRSIQRLLNDAEKRTLSGYGAQVYLEYQWGDAANESTFFDILRGDLLMPGDYLNVHLKTGYMIPNAQIRLVCKPFGRYTNQDITQATLDNSQSPYDLIYSYLVDDSTSYGVEEDTWMGQTFTTTSAFTIAGAAFKCYRTGTISDVTCELYATVAGKPSGGILATGTLDVSTLSTVSDASHIQWIRILFDTPYALSDATMYAVVLHIPELDPNFLYCRYDAAGAAFANGTAVYSTDDGSNWTILGDGDLMFGIYVAETKANYQDITTSEAYGDVPAKMYWKVDPNDSTGNQKTWLAKRTGSRYDDDLWIESESYYSTTALVGGYTYENYGLVADDVSGGLYCEHTVENAAGIAADTAIGYFYYRIAYDAIPKGTFRVLARCRVACQDAADYDHLSFGVGWVYGDSSKAPSASDGDYYECSADSTWEILDLGLLNILPIADSDIATNNNFNILIYNYASQALTGNEYYKWQMDYIFLLPIDEGVLIVDGVASTRVLIMDGITDPPLVFEAIDNTESTIPAYVGNHFSLGRESTRLYYLRDDGHLAGCNSDVKYQPQFLVI